jgi:hypothetical protein
VISQGFARVAMTAVDQQQGYDVVSRHFADAATAYQTFLTPRIPTASVPGSGQDSPHPSR